LPPIVLDFYQQPIQTPRAVAVRRTSHAGTQHIPVAAPRTVFNCAPRIALSPHDLRAASRATCNRASVATAVANHYFMQASGIAFSSGHQYTERAFFIHAGITT
jgi:hypothetical protein